MAGSAEHIIEVRGLKKSYGDVLAVDGIDFDVERGELFAFLGINGAGKSTTINIMCTLISKDAGTVRIAGYDTDNNGREVRRHMGMVFQSGVLDGMLTVRDNLCVRAALYGKRGEEKRRAVADVSEMFGLGDILSRRYGRLSGGQRRRVDIARALIASPDVLVLDEPTTGLDPQTRKNVWSALADLREKRGTTVFLTTHYMEEANRADNVTIIDAGRIVCKGTPASLKSRYSGDYLKIYAPYSEELGKRFAVLNAVYEDNKFVIKANGSNEIKRLLALYGDVINDFEAVKGDMDDVFLNVTGKKLTGGGV